MKQELIVDLQSRFNAISHNTNDENVEFWYARDLQTILGYDKWENFFKVIEKAKISCENSQIEVTDHFLDVRKMVEIGSNAQREIADVVLTRYACYLIAQNGDSSKEQIAFAQTYFALQTRKQELIEQRIELEDRLKARNKLKNSETELSKNIYERGVDDKGFGRIRSQGDGALFGGYNTKDMKDKLGISSGRVLADFLPTVTITAKNLATEITNHNVKQNNLYGENSITHEHVTNNKNVRKLLVESGIKPEELPPSQDLQKLERKVKSDEKKLIKSSALPKKV
ncbi:DNA damage-inducible protein D [Sulfurospirillum multivorans]|uniref:DNA-damage-inducible protein D n=2 Tax=Sulfurospirillum multivorans TaxID=66821 RepID=A0AA86DZ82_SULMK|nr:DNA damage-inducible protein D [Sulfurospirillum multivorans]AHJ12505.1 DNA-damage-inducible protein D [Sulfurospirillum multivorans DSM 12446]QEH06000.1 DNA-damage-inducible protein D [Sulfurospirillum multivorans]